jgi:hypothetical protein
MSFYTQTTVHSACTANITSSRNRLKIYGNSVYLKDKQSFEIELFNPTQGKVLAKIEINGKSISNSGIVLKPGERVYIERFIDSNNKFLFETYEVEDSEEVAKATEKNGLVEIFFYPEMYHSSISTWITTYPTWITTYPTYTHPIYNINNGTTANYYTNYNSISKNITVTESTETGRVEMGESSSQEFTSVNGTFTFLPSNSVSVKILPESHKPLESKDLRRNYCSGCGTRVKKQSWKFCPSCGEKF